MRVIHHLISIKIQITPLERVGYNSPNWSESDNEISNKKTQNPKVPTTILSKIFILGTHNNLNSNLSQIIKTHLTYRRATNK